jgi:uncharacterized repeat protein (TIGR01451 family)
MKSYLKQLSLLTLLFFLIPTSHSQTVGDITLSHSFNHVHDPSTCNSTVITTHSLTIENSFIGDEVEVFYHMGMPPYQETNTTGVSPWVIPNFAQSNTVFSDILVNGNLLEENVNSIIYKVRVDTDSIMYPVFFAGGPLFSNTIADPCSFFHIEGNVYDDVDGSCTYSAGDIPFNFFQYIHFQTYPSFSSGYFASGVSNGFYVTTTLPQDLIDSIEIYLPPFYQFIFPQVGCVQTSYMLPATPHTGIDFILDCGSLDTDVAVDGHTIGPVRPFLNFGLNAMIGNLGCHEFSGVLKVVMDPNVTYNAALSTKPADWIDGDTLFFNFTSLNNATGGGYWQSMLGYINFTADGSLNIGDSVCFEIMSDYPIADVNPQNNHVIRCFPVVNSYDPNNKLVEPKGIGSEGFIPANNEKFTYKINFQNTGNAPALDVVLIDTLDVSTLIPSSLKILSTSHAMEPYWLDDNIIQFVYNDINLPDSATNLIESQGYVVFEIDMAQGLTEGTEIKNKAEIYFDTNDPIITNFATNTIEFIIGLDENIETNDFTLYPNPTSSLVKINSKENIESLKVVDLKGKVVYENLTVNSSMLEVDLSSYETGIFIVEVTINAVTSFRKVVKLNY